MKYAFPALAVLSLATSPLAAQKLGKGGTSMRHPASRNARSLWVRWRSWKTRCRRSMINCRRVCAKEQVGSRPAHRRRA